MVDMGVVRVEVVAAEVVAVEVVDRGDPDRGILLLPAHTTAAAAKSVTMTSSFLKLIYLFFMN